MAILQDFEDYASGTDLSPLDPKQADPFSGDTNVAALDPSQILLGMEYARARQDAATAYEQNFPKYQSRLKEFVYQAPERDIFDLASDLGAGILASQQKRWKESLRWHRHWVQHL